MKFDIKKYGLKEKWGVSLATIKQIQTDIEAEFGVKEEVELEAQPKPKYQPKQNGSRL